MAKSKAKTAMPKPDAVRVYAFGALAPTEGLELVEAQIRLAHQYRNALVEMEHERRRRSDAVVAASCPELESLAAEAELDLARADASRRNSEARSRRAAAGSEELPQARRALKEARARYKARRKEAYADPALKAALAEVADWAGARGRELRAEFSGRGLYWGSYLPVEDAAKGFRKGAPPKFHRFEGEGKVAVQIQKGMTVARLHGCGDTRLRLTPVADGVKGRQRKAVAHVRVGSSGRDPVWATVPVLLHRPIPSDCVIKWAYLVKRRVATHAKWQLQLVCERGAGWERADLPGSGTVAVDLGWRRLRGVGMRAAYWRGDDGEHGELVLPESVLRAWAHPDELRGVRDDNFSAVKLTLAAWLRGDAAPPECLSAAEAGLERLAASATDSAEADRIADRRAYYANWRVNWGRPAELPEWLTEWAATVSQWRSPARLAALLIGWRGRRFNGDDRAFWCLEAWRRQDKHLYDWEGFERRGASNKRNATYRDFAAELRTRYRTVRCEDANWKDIVRTPEPDEEDVCPTRYHARIAAPGTLREVLEQGFANWQRIRSAGTTSTCHECGATCEWDRRQLEHTCFRCGATWDQDDNACRNMLASGEVVSEKPGAARVAVEAEAAGACVAAGG